MSYMVPGYWSYTATQYIGPTWAPVCVCNTMGQAYHLPKPDSDRTAEHPNTYLKLISRIIFLRLPFKQPLQAGPNPFLGWEISLWKPGTHHPFSRCSWNP